MIPFGMILWRKEPEKQLSLRDRSLVTVVSLMAQVLTDSSFRYHSESAKKNGVLMTHLDVQAKDSLKTALSEFPGTVLFVSHEENFYKEWVQKVINIENV